MSNTTHQHSSSDDPSDNDNRGSYHYIALMGWSIILIFFGIFGTWSLIAPLNGAVVANGFIKVESNKKSVQHLDGGIVKELRVREGDLVHNGDLLILLDDSQARAEYEVLSQQYLVLRSTEERLKAEFFRADELKLPADLEDRAKETDLINIWRGQIHQFETRIAVFEGQRRVIQERIAQFDAQIQGAESQVRSYRAQYESVQQEIQSVEPLVEKGVITKPRYLQLVRSGIALEGQAAEATASIAKARQGIAEQKQQIAQLDHERMASVTKDLRDTQAKLLEVIPRRANAKAVLGRVEIRAPYSGRVVGLTVFSVGGVINRGEKILELVPNDESLIIEAQIAVEDISELKINMHADVHLTAYKQRITPVVAGEIMQISADRMIDNRTGAPYYTAFVKVDEQEVERIPNGRLYPGMPATIIIPTIQRSAFEYLVGPLILAFNKSFRQR
jgi:HlyD family type I secretion membrane fusion protein